MVDLSDLMAASRAVVDPDTTGGDLMRIAQAQPSLWAQVAGHPAAYSGLLDWLAANGDDAVKRVVAARQAVAAPLPPPPPPPPPPAVAARPQELPSSIDPPHTAGSTRSASPRLVLVLILALAVVLAGVGVTVVLTRQPKNLTLDQFNALIVKTLPPRLAPNEFWEVEWNLEPPDPQLASDWATPATDAPGATSPWVQGLLNSVHTLSSVHTPSMSFVTTLAIVMFSDQTAAAGYARQFSLPDIGHTSLLASGHVGSVPTWQWLLLRDNDRAGVGDVLAYRNLVAIVFIWALKGDDPLAYASAENSRWVAFVPQFTAAVDAAAQTPGLPASSVPSDFRTDPPPK